MNKKILALKILLPILVILLVALLTFEIKCFDIHNGTENGLLFAVAILLNIIPMIAMIILGIATIIVSVLLFIIKKRLPVIIIALIILCLLIPFAGYSVFVDIAALRMFIEVPIIAVVVFAVDIAAMVLCCMAIHEYRMIKRGQFAVKNL